MVNINKGNILKEDSEIKGRGFTVFLNDDGILQVDINEMLDERGVAELVTNAIEIAKKLSNNAKILVNMNMAPHIPSIMFRKEVIKTLKNTIKELTFERVAVCGGGTIQKIVTSFIITAARLKNIKYFVNEEEAVKWLKEEDKK